MSVRRIWTFISGGILLVAAIVAILAYFGINPPRPSLSSSCDDAQVHFPQSIADVNAYFSIPNGSNVSLVYENCGSVATGFIYHGNASISVTVPRGGCIDADSRASFTNAWVSNNYDDGRRAYEGMVTAPGMTYRAVNCYSP